MGRNKNNTIYHRWFLHDGGERPINGDLLVSLELSSGLLAKKTRANGWMWRTSTSPLDATVVRFKLLKE